MANISKIRRDKMIAFLEGLKKTHSDDESIRAFNEIENSLLEKKYGLVFEEHTEEVDERLQEEIPILCEDKERRICKDESLPWNFIIEGDNLQALYLLEKTHKGKIDCIYIDPPYNTGAKDWKYNNDYVDSNDVYRHSKWLSMMKSRLLIAKRLLNPENSVLICTIDEKEYLRLGCLLEELFPEARIQMISSVISSQGSTRDGLFSRADEYIYFVFLGEAEVRKSEDDMLNEGQSATKGQLWFQFVRTGKGNLRENSKKLFYPIFADPIKGKIISIGASIPLDVPKESIPIPDGQIAIWPITADGKEARWRTGTEIANRRLKCGLLRLGKTSKKENGWSVLTVNEGTEKRIELGEVVIESIDDVGAAQLVEKYGGSLRAPKTVWNKVSHNAGWHGSKLLAKILLDRKFPYPKSLYAVRDALKIVTSKMDALFVDFFAGSGTTLHAVNLLNAEDGGHRQCIMVTNNEVSADEEKRLTQQGYKKGDDEWEKLGIAKYVTWPRTVCSIEGKDINGKPLKGDYITDCGHEIKMSDGFKCNVKYFKCDWISRKPEDYLLSNALCLHIKEMIELQMGHEVDGIKQVLILNKDDYNKAISDPEILAKVETIWLNQNMILSPEEMKPLKAKGFKYIPREFFGHELREAAE